MTRKSISRPRDISFTRWCLVRRAMITIKKDITMEQQLFWVIGQSHKLTGKTSLPILVL
ncbi:hypothetical protein SCLCIDRAFT_1219686 [Scleroderma citrinum Foug A]|uniref:Uncharacterized protein n=1 Tax=Scleroderma citrinum Foug A TaxID=1036808 RepID=A0A0C2ZXN7_9AGAM|nr:hypothetical protein SCLCIDRAFT_1219686 [Scleroderma citrinum Foug A]